jgi:hypothetical protein
LSQAYRELTGRIDRLLAVAERAIEANGDSPPKR